MAAYGARTAFEIKTRNGSNYSAVNRIRRKPYAQCSYLRSFSRKQRTTTQFFIKR